MCYFLLKISIYKLNVCVTMMVFSSFVNDAAMLWKSFLWWALLHHVTCQHLFLVVVRLGIVWFFDSSGENDNPHTHTPEVVYCTSTMFLFAFLIIVLKISSLKTFTLRHYKYLMIWVITKLYLGLMLKRLMFLSLSITPIQ